MTDKPRCSATVYVHWSSPCARNGVVQENGKWWCKQHAPSTVAKRKAEKAQRWKEKWAKQRREWDLANLRDQIANEVLVNGVANAADIERM